MFNALKYIKRLEEVGFPREQAEAQLQIVIDVIDGELATKVDLGNLRSELKTDISELRAELKADIAEVKSEMATFRQEVAHQFTNQEYKIVTKIGVLVVTTVTLAVAMSTWLIKLR